MRATDLAQKEKPVIKKKRNETAEAVLLNGEAQGKLVNKFDLQLLLIQFPQKEKSSG